MRTIRLFLLIVALLSVTLVAAPSARGSGGARFEERFEERFGSAEWWRSWGRDAAPQGTQQMSSLFDGDHLRVSFRPGEQLGATWSYDLGAAERAVMSYRVRFGAAWIPMETGKLPGFGRPELLDSGGCLQACGRREVQGDAPFYSARASYGVLNTGSSYLYGPQCAGDESSLTGARLDWHDMSFRNGVWYTVEQDLTMNTPDDHNGSLIVRVDGKEVLRVEDLCLRTSADVPIGMAWMQFFHGGRLPSLSPLNWIDLDDVVIEY